MQDSGLEAEPEEMYAMTPPVERGGNRAIENLIILIIGK